MPVLKYKDPTDGLWKPVPVGANSVINEVYIGSVLPTDPAVEHWIDPLGTGNPGEAGSYLPIAGGTVTGNLVVQGDTNVQKVNAALGADMGGHKVANVADPTVSTDAVSMNWATARNPPIIVLGANDPVPPATTSGTIIVRTA